MKTILGFFFIIAGFVTAIIHLGYGFMSLYDFVALAIVLGGTLAVVIMTMPSIDGRIILTELYKTVFSSFVNKRQKTVFKCLTLIKGKVPELDPAKIEERILFDGVELLALGFPKDKIQEILLDRLEMYAEDVRKVSHWLRSLAKYPPAFGLAGTVLGLIHLMRGLAEGADPKETGVRMAIALVATLYGIILSNTILNPLGERILSNLSENITLCEISIRSVLMTKEKTHVLVAQEHLNSFLTSNKRVNIMSQYLEAN